MKKVCFFAYVMCSCCFAKDLSIEEISDTVRELTGRIEALEKKISDNGSNETSVASSESQEDFEKLVTGQNPEDLIRQIIAHIDENDMNYIKARVTSEKKIIKMPQWPICKALRKMLPAPNQQKLYTN